MSTFDDVQEPVQREEEETSLTGIDFSGQKLGALDFAGKTLTDCNFSGCDLEGSDFTGASVTRCDMSLAQLSDCVFDEAHLTEVTLAKAKLSFASFVRSHLSHVSLAFASLEQALLQACVFEDVSWPSVSLVQATLLELSHLPPFLEADLTQTQCLGCDEPLFRLRAFFAKLCRMRHALAGEYASAMCGLQRGFFRFTLSQL